jgi:hypothetical protein
MLHSSSFQDFPPFQTQIHRCQKKKSLHRTFTECGSIRQFKDGSNTLTMLILNIPLTSCLQSIILKLLQSSLFSCSIHVWMPKHATFFEWLLDGTWPSTWCKSVRIQHHKITVSGTAMAQVVPNKLMHHTEGSGLWHSTFWNAAVDSKLFPALLLDHRNLRNKSWKIHTDFQHHLAL